MKKGLKKPMNKQDKQDLELILYRLNEQDKSVQKLEKHFTSKFNEIQEDISFIKENLFNPNEGYK